MNVTLANVTKKFGAVTVVNDVSAAIGDGELFFLLGPSGCGKTTLLRLIAGLYPLDAGQLCFAGRVMNEVPPNKRNAALVFQNYALWPHLSVAANVAYGLEVRRVPAPARAQRVQEALAVVRMTEYASRSPAELSGGQQQRVALARALVIKPDVLLLDEPLSNLDAKLRLEMRGEIRRIHAATGLTTIYVTHDQEEALSLADRIAVMCDGRIEQVGTPRELYRAPRNRFVAGFMGEANFVAGVAGEADGELLRVTTALGELRCARPAGAAIQAGQKVVAVIRPESVRLADLPTANRFAALISSVSYLGEVEQYGLDLSQGTTWQGTEPNPSVVRRRGDQAVVSVKPEDVILVPE